MERKAILKAIRKQAEEAITEGRASIRRANQILRNLKGGEYAKSYGKKVKSRS